MVNGQKPAIVPNRANIQIRQSLGHSNERTPFAEGLEWRRAWDVVEVASEEHDGLRAAGRGLEHDTSCRARFGQTPVRIVVHFGAKVRNERYDFAFGRRDMRLQQIPSERRGLAVRKLSLIHISEPTRPY